MPRYTKPPIPDDIAMMNMSEAKAAESFLDDQFEAQVRIRDEAQGRVHEIQKRRYALIQRQNELIAALMNNTKEGH